MASFDCDEDEAALLRKHASRSPQVTALCSMLAQADQPLPPAIHVHDACSAPSTSHLVQDVVGLATRRNRGKRRRVVVDPLTAPTTQHLWAHLSQAATDLRASSGASTSRSTLDTDIETSLEADGVGEATFESCLQLLRDTFSSAALASRVGTSHSSANIYETSMVVLIKRAERMRELWSDPAIEALYNLGELCDMTGRVCIVSLSSLGTSHFRTARAAAARRGPGSAISIVFARLGKEDFIAAAARDAEQMIGATDAVTVSASDLESLYRQYVSIAYDAFSADVRELNELRLLCCCAWHPFIRPLLDGEISSPSLQQLLIRSPGLFQDALDTLLTRRLSPEEWVAKSCASRFQGQERKRKIDTPRHQAVTAMSPTMTYLLLASFLASYNPSRLDVRYFVRDESAVLVQTGDGEPGRRNRKRGGAFRKKPHRKARKHRRGADGESGELLNRQALLGPRPFIYDRLLSIFQALVTESGVGTRAADSGAFWEIKAKSVATTEAVSKLLRLGLLVRTSGVERLDVNMTLRSNVTHDIISAISRQAHFDLEEWLWDWAS